MSLRYKVGIFIALFALLAIPFANAFASPTGHEVAPEFRDFYDRSGGLPVFGYAVSDPVLEDDRLVQYFERQRLELHPENAGTPYEIQLGLLGVAEARDRGLLETEPFQPLSGVGSDRYTDFFPQTGHRLSHGFRDYWRSNGLDFGDPGVSYRESLALFGYPISEEFVDPDTGLVTQYFERARFEFHPENAGTVHSVLLGHLGNAEWQRLRGFQRGRVILPAPQQRGNNPAPQPTPTPEPAPEQPAQDPPQQEQNESPPPVPEPDDSNNEQNEQPENNPPPPPAPTPNTSIQQLVNNASSGATVRVPAGIYRETVTINKPITLIADPGAEIRGSDVWTSWTRSGNQWVSSQTVPSFNNDNHGHCESSVGDSCKWREQVFVNGQQLTQVASNPQSGQFAVNNQRQIVLGQDPSGRTVEVSVRSYWVRGEASNVTIDGFTMKHATNRAQTGAINNDGRNNWTIRNNTMSHAHAANVSLLRGSGHRLINNDIGYAGQLGVHSYDATDVRIEGNRIHNNNTQRFQWSWEGGGLKVVTVRNVVITGNEAHNNRGPGLWCDIDCADVTISNNRVHNNRMPGIIYELSRDGKILGNKVWQNGHGASEGPGRSGIFIQNSQYTEVADNVVAWNGGGIVVWSEDRGQSRWNNVVGNTVRNNNIFIVSNRPWDEYGLAWIEWRHSNGMANSSSNNRGSNNAYFHANANDASYNTFVWVGQNFGWNQLNGFNGTHGENNGRYLNNSEKNQILNTAGIPTNP